MRKALANILYLVCGLPLALCALTLISIRPWALDRDFYRRALSDDRLYQSIAAASKQPSSRASGRAEIGGIVFDGEALSRAIGANLPAAEAEATALAAVDEALDLVEGAQRDGRFDLDLRKLKAAARAKVPAAARDYVLALPSRPEAPQAGDFSFRPASLSQAAAEKRASEALAGRIDALPDSVSAPVDARVVLNGSRVFLTRAALGRAAASLAAAAGIALAGLAALGGAGIAGRIAKAGRYLLPPSVVVLALGALMSLPGSALALAAMPQAARDLLSDPAAAALRDYLASVVGPIARSFFVTGLVGASLGGLLTQATRIAEPKQLE